MKWPVVAKAQAEEPGCRQGHSGISPITNPPKDSRSLCRTPHSRDLATTVAESCPHMGPCSPCVCLQDTQLWPESGREQEGLAEVTYPTPVTSQDPSIPHPKVSFHIPFSRGSPSVSPARRTDQGRRGSNDPPFPTRKGAPHHLSFLRAS